MKNPDQKTSAALITDSTQQNDSDLETLQKLLVGIDREQAEDVFARVQQLDRRSDDIHEALVDAISKLNNDEQTKVMEHLSSVAASSLKTSIRNDPDNVTEIVYPIMLPAIRQAVADSMRSALERIDNMFTSKLSPQSIKWRIEAKRCGVSYAEVLLRNTMHYGVEQAFLIDRKSGLLMQHVSTLGSSKKDEDAVSAMFLAIERFVKDSFSEDDDALQRVTIGERLVYLAHGPHALLACVVKGSPPSDFLTNVQSTLETIHAKEPETLKNFSGDRDSLASINPIMSELLDLDFEQKEEESEDFNDKALIGMQVLLTAGLLLLAYMWFQSMQEKRVNQYKQELNTNKHIQVFHAEKREGIWELKGIIDPSGPTPPDITHSAFVNERKVALQLTPVRFLDANRADEADSN